MFGLTLEKLVLVAVIAAVLIGPGRMPQYAHRLAELVRGLRTVTETLRTRAEGELGMPVGTADWRSLDPRAYDPRRIIRDALIEHPSPSTTAERTDAAPGDAEASAPQWRYIVTGSSAHPRRVRVPIEPAPDVSAPSPDVPGRATATPSSTQLPAPASRA